MFVYVYVMYAIVVCITFTVICIAMQVPHAADLQGSPWYEVEKIQEMMRIISFAALPVIIATYLIDNSLVLTTSYLVLMLVIVFAGCPWYFNRVIARRRSQQQLPSVV